MSSSDSGDVEKNIEFGETLKQAREAQKLSIDDIAELLKVPSKIILLIEASDVRQLPAPTFARGYLCAYAKRVGIQDVNILAAYDRVMPRKIQLRPRSNLPRKTTSQSPLVKAVTFILIILGVLAIAYSGYQYYGKKVSSMEASLQYQAEQNAGKVNALTGLKQQVSAEKKTADRISGFNVTPALTDKADNSARGELASARVLIKNKQVQINTRNTSNVPQGVDNIQLLAKNGAWVEISDATDKRLHYNMIPKDKWVSYNGTAPFKVSLGNARSTRIKVNNLTIDMSKHIRSNNTAKFKISTIKRNGHQIAVFH